MYYSPHFVDRDFELHSSKLYLNLHSSRDNLPNNRFFLETFAVTRVDNLRMLRKQLMEEQEHALELERIRLSEMKLSSKSLNHHSHFRYSMDELKFSEGATSFRSRFYFLGFIFVMLIRCIASAEHAEFPSADRFNYFPASEDKLKHINTIYSDQDRY